MGSDIFLSYSRADQQVALGFVKTASGRGLSVWYDQMIEGGEDWRGKIVDALGTSKALVILFSDHSNSSLQLIKELAIADRLQKLVVPVLIENCEPRGPYLYELASRNWVILHPNPETRLAALIEKLIKELDLLDSRRPPTSASVDQAPVAQPTDSMPDRTSSAAPVALPMPSAPAQGRGERWFPLERYDLYVLVPILVLAFLLSEEVGVALSLIASLCYMFALAVRNARLNRGIFSGKSFASYFTVFAVGISPVVYKGTTFTEYTWVGFLIITSLLAVIANVLQAILRMIFQQKTFRSKIEQPLEERAG